MRNQIIAIAALAMLSGCVTRQAIPTASIHDGDMTCEQLRAEAVSMGAEIQDREGDSGLTGKNVAAALIFWPGIIVNEVNANRNVRDAQARSEHLTRLYYDKGCNKG